MIWFIGTGLEVTLANSLYKVAGGNVTPRTTIVKATVTTPTEAKVKNASGAGPPVLGAV